MSLFRRVLVSVFNMVATRNRTSTGGDTAQAAKRPFQEAAKENFTAEEPPAKRVKIVEPTTDKPTEDFVEETPTANTTKEGEVTGNTDPTSNEDNCGEANGEATENECTAEEEPSTDTNENMNGMPAEAEAGTDTTANDTAETGPEQESAENDEDEQETEPLDEENVMSSKIENNVDALPADIAAVEA